MESFKILNFERDHPGQAFPPFRSLSHAEVLDLRREVALRLGLDRDADGLALVRAVESAAVDVSPTVTPRGALDLERTLRGTHIPAPRSVYINWYRFDRVDEVLFADVAAHFEYFHYPDSDDTDVIDRDLEWILCVSHDERVRLLRL